MMICYTEKVEEVNKFLGRVKTDFTQLRFVEGRKFTFRSPRTIIFEPGEVTNRYKMAVLHEIGHALLGHKFYTTDPERLRMESEAWGKAKELCSRYAVEFEEEFAEGELDSYREWLHRRSRCGECGLTRFQTKDGKYHCPGCKDC